MKAGFMIIMTSMPVMSEFSSLLDKTDGDTITKKQAVELLENAVQNAASNLEKAQKEREE